MPEIRLPSGALHAFTAPLNASDLLRSISPQLAASAVAVRVDGGLRDLDRELTADAEVVTRNSADGMELLRHDCAHVLAQAVKELWPQTQVTIGPAIENGFYYDFAREQPFTLDDLQVIEQRMREIVDRNVPFVREEWDRTQAVAFFRDVGEHYKAELVEAIPAEESITIYRQGEWLDLCRGPHLPATGLLGKAFKLLRVSGAYWRGDSTKPMLQRIYGTCWPDQKQLRTYLHQLEEAERRDHRRLGREMDLFHLQDLSPGAIFWHPRGQRLFTRLEQYIRQRNESAGYQEVNTPQVMDRSLWEASGHWETFRENMFTTHTEDGRAFALKPMNCPGHVQIFKHGAVKSYRDLPLRIAEFGKVHRYEPSGALHGLVRVRAFVQDDAHVFCTPEQITDEAVAMCRLILSIYRDFDFAEVRIKFSDRPQKRVGSDGIWSRAEAALMAAIDSTDLPYQHNRGEGAFYGPKLEFVLRDAIGRDWQCGTVQVDFNMPGRLAASYVDPHGERQTPVMLHRAMLGSIERFIGILIEHHSGKLPLWYAPLHVVVCTITDAAAAYALTVAAALKAAGLAVESDLRNEKIAYKVRAHSVAKVPLIFALGEREMNTETVSMRRLGSKAQQTMPLSEAVAMLASEARMPSEESL